MSGNVYNQYAAVEVNLLEGNVHTIATQSNCLNMWVNTNEDLTTNWTSSPVATLADPSQPWNPETNPYVPEGDTYNPSGPDYGDVANPSEPYNADTNPFVPPGCTYNPNGPDYGDVEDPSEPYNPITNPFVMPDPAPEGCSQDEINQVNMVNGLNTTTDPDSMNAFLTTYGTYPYLDDWSQAFVTTVMTQAQVGADGDESSMATTNMQLINSFSSMISSEAQVEEAPGHTLISMLQNLIQNSGSAQQTITDSGDSVMGVESNIASLLQQPF